MGCTSVQDCYLNCDCDEGCHEKNQCSAECYAQDCPGVDQDYYEEQTQVFKKFTHEDLESQQKNNVMEGSSKKVVQQNFNKWEVPEEEGEENEGYGEQELPEEGLREEQKY